MLKIDYRNKVFFVCLVLTLFSLSGMSSSSEYDWDGSSGVDWNTSANWSPTANTQNRSQVYNVGAPSGYSNPSNSPVLSGNISYSRALAAIQVFDGGNLTHSGGTNTMTNDLVIYNGGEVTITGGTLNCTDIYLLDANSSLVLSGGNLNCSGTIYLGKESPDNAQNNPNGTPTITVNSGIITCSNIAFEDNEGDNPELIILGGEVQVSGDVRSDGAPVKISIGGSGLLDINDDLLMDAGNGLLTMTSGNLELAGDWTNTGSEALSDGKITLNGTGNQTINVNSSVTFHDLTLNNVGGSITFSDDVFIDGNLVFTDGIVDAGSNTVTFNSGSSHSGASSISYIDGEVSEIGGVTFTFPVGDGANYQPLTITANPGGGSEQFSARYNFVNPSGLLGWGLGIIGIGLDHVSTKEYWELIRETGSTSSASVVLSWNSNSGIVDNLSELRVCHYNSVTAKWEDVGNAGTTGNLSAGTITSGPISSFSPFSLGSSTSNNPLEVSYLDFSVHLEDDNAVLKWSTASEVNNDFFEIQRSTDGKQFSPIGLIKSLTENGMSNRTLNYSFVDDKLHENNYYRLKQVDFDGSFEFSNTLFVRYIKSSVLQNNNDFRVFPNPLTSSQNRLNFVLDFPVGYVQISDFQGKILSTSDQYIEDGDLGYISLNGKLPPGNYLVSVFSLIGELKFTTQLVVR